MWPQGLGLLTPDLSNHLFQWSDAGMATQQCSILRIYTASLFHVRNKHTFSVFENLIAMRLTNPAIANEL